MLGRQLASVAFVLVAIAPLALPAAEPAALHVPQLRDQSGRAFTLASLRGEPLIVTFVAAHCTDACPLIDAQFQQIAERIAHEHLRVRLLTVTLDPEHDSPATMRRLARSFDADPALWLMASGNERDVHAVMRAFNVIARRGRRGYADVHTTFVYLLDAHGVLRKTMLASSTMTAEVLATVAQNWRMLTQ